MPTISLPLTRLVAVFLLMLSAAQVAAQSPFTPVARVNDSIVTQWELDQRIRLLTALRAPGELRAQALERLIDDRLQAQAAELVGIEVSEEDVRQGLAEFANRADLTAEQFLELLAQAGVEEETALEFIRAGLVWRQAVQARFGPRVQISPEDIEKARTEIRPSAGLRLLLSEIILPANTPQNQAEARALAAELTQIGSIAEFAEAARRYSAAPTRDVGGRVEWVAVGDLPQPVAAAVTTLRPGQVTAPLPLPNAIALFQLRAIEEVEAPQGAGVSVNYAQFLIPGGRSQDALAEAARVKARVDTCNDLYGVAQGLPPSRLLRDERPVDEVPQDIALQLARLDEGEVSTALTRGDALVFLMLCERDTGGDLATDEAAIRNRLRAERLTALADAWLAELRADAHIVRPD